MGEPLQVQVTVTNTQGFHIRPATAFAQLANQYQCRVFLSKANGERFDGKSPMSLLGMVAGKNTQLTLEVDGPDQEQALVALVELWGTFSQYDSETSNVSGEQ